MTGKKWSRESLSAQSEWFNLQCVLPQQACCEWGRFCFKFKIFKNCLPPSKSTNMTVKINLKSRCGLNTVITRAKTLQRAQ